MRRTIGLGILVIVLVLVGLPAALGWQLSKYHDRYVRQLSVPGVMTVRDVAFSRGILRSRSRVTLTPAPEICGDQPCPDIIVDSVIHHGPIAFTAPPATPGGLQIGLGVIVSKADISPLFPGVQFDPALPKPELVTRVDLAGAVDSELVLAPVRLRITGEEAGGRVNMERLHASVQTPATHDAVRGQFNWPSFKLVAGGGGQLAWQGLAAEFTGDAQTPLFWRRFGLKLNSLQMVDAEGQSLSLQGLLWDANNTAAPDNRLASEFKMRLSQLAVSNRDYGPVILEGQIKGLDVASLEAIQAAVRNLNPQALPPELLLLALSGIYQTHMPALLAAGPELSVSRLMIGTQDGDIVADMNVALADYPGADSDLAAVLKRLELTLNLRMPVPVLQAAVNNNLQQRGPEYSTTREDIEAGIKALIDANWVVAKPEENAFVTKLRIQNQNLSVNGEVRDGWQDMLKALDEGQAPAVSEPQSTVQ